jgi:hypothetical protein
VRLSDLQRRLPVVDRVTYERAYAEAALAGRIGELVHGLRREAGMSVAELALAAGVDEEEVAHAEEGGPGATPEFYERLGRALRDGTTRRAGPRPAGGDAGGVGPPDA